MPTEAQLADGVVVVRAGKIVAAGRRDAVAIPPGATIVDCRGRFLVAGFQNSHVHFIEPKWDRAQALPAAQLSRQFEEIALRNIAIGFSRGDLVCQWDDDNRHHPMRLELQVGALVAEQAGFCFLGDQLHRYPSRGEMSSDDWDREACPLDVVQGTLLGRRALMPRYPEVARGEDTSLCLAILGAGHRIASLRGTGGCYVYVCHGGNAWSLGHHAANSSAKQLGAARLLASERILRARLAGYRPSLGAVVLPHARGQIEIG